MNNMKFQQIGWVVAGVLAGVMLGSGFQAKSDKFGVVDLGDVFSQSNFAKSQTETLKSMGQVRQDLIQFANTYPVLSQEQAQRFKELSLKPQLTAAEKTELEKIKNDAMAQDKKFKDKQLVPKPTPEDIAYLREMSDRQQAMGKTLDRWSREFSDEFQSVQEKLRSDTLDRVKAAVKEVGSKQGFSIVFSQDAAPYAANSITADALSAMNAKKQ